MLQYESKQESFNLYTYEMKRMAQSWKEAQRLIDGRADYFQSLYDDIICRSVSLDPYVPSNGNASTDHQALHIIDSKEAYDLRILKAKQRYGTWRRYLQDFSEDDAELLVRYFEDNNPISEKTILRLLETVGEVHDSYLEANEKAKDFDVYEDYQEELKSMREEHCRPKGIMILQNGKLVEQESVGIFT